MKILIQRVSYSSVYIDKKLYVSSSYGLLLFLGFHKNDGIISSSLGTDKVIDKILNLKIFNTCNENKKDNRSVLDIKGDIMVISQFTLYATIKKGNSPSYSNSMNFNKAKESYDDFIKKLKAHSSLSVYSGKFGSHMEIESKNIGPYTLIVED